MLANGYTIESSVHAIETLSIDYVEQAELTMEDDIYSSSFGDGSRSEQIRGLVEDWSFMTEEAIQAVDSKQN